MVTEEDVKKIKSAFKGKDTVVSKHTPMYPYSCERELKRIMVDYADAIIKDVKKKLPEMERAYKNQLDSGLRLDGLMDFQHDLLDELVSVSDEIEKESELKKYDKLVTKVGRLTSKHISNEWDKGIQKTFKVESENSDFGAMLFTMALSRFTADVKTRMKDMKEKLVSDVISQLTDSFKKGQSMTDAFKQLSKKFSKIKRKAGMEARDIIGNLTSQMKQEVGSHFGCDLYIWVTKRDDRVRECHRTLDGKIFRWSNPPEMWYRRGGQIVYTGRRCNPGEDYGCRCVAKFVFSWEGIKEFFGIGKRGLDV